MPFSLTALIATFFILKNVLEPRPEKLDVLGVIASTIGFGIAGKAGWGSVTVLTALSVGIVSLILFVIRQLKTDHPLIDLDFLSQLSMPIPL